MLGLYLHQQGIAAPVYLTACITLITAVWWVTEALPIPATSLFPFAAFPLTGVLTHQQAAAGLGSHVIVLLMGGFMVAKGLEKSGLHRRFAISILKLVGAQGGKRIVFAFMLAGALISMWISNTATCLMLMPIALAVLARLNDARLNTPVILGMAYACSTGGIATLIGTPPNVIFAGIYEEITGQEFNFLEWMRIGLPIVVLGIPLMWLWLTRRVRPTGRVELPPRETWRAEERRVLVVFLLTVLLWITRTGPFGGWSALLGIGTAGDSTVALMAVVAMFLVPSGKPGEALLDWKTAVDIPWGMLLLFASGLTIARAFGESGLADLIGNELTGAVHLPPYLLILLLCLSVTFITEITSNTATTTLLMPILGATAIAAGLPAEMLMIPAAISASCAYMLPVATAPNAIAYGTGYANIPTMAREGFALNLIMAVVISLVSHLSLAA